MRLKRLGNRHPACWKALKAMPEAWIMTKPVFKRVAVPGRPGVYTVLTTKGQMDITEARRLGLGIILSVSSVWPAKNAAMSDLGRYRKAIAGDAIASAGMKRKRFERMTRGLVPSTYTPQEKLSYSHFAKL